MGHRVMSSPSSLRSLFCVLVALVALSLSVVAVAAPGEGGSDAAEPTQPPAYFWLNLQEPGRQELQEQLQLAVDALKADLGGIALNHAERAIRAEPDAAIAYYIAGTAALELKAYDRAIRYFERQRELDPEADAKHGTCFQLAIAHSHLEDWKGTIEEYQKCLDLDVAKDPNRIIYYGNMAETYMALGDLDHAIDAYREALQLDTTQLHALLGLGVALARKGRRDDARLVLRLGLIQDPDLAVMTGDSVFFIPEGDGDFHVGLMLEELGRIDEAKFRYRRFLRGAEKSAYHEQTRQHLDALEGKRSALVDSIPAPTSRITTAAIDAEQRWLALGTREGRLSLLDLETRKTFDMRMDGGAHPVPLDMAFTTDGKELRVLFSTGEVLRLDPKRSLKQLGRYQLGEVADGSFNRRSLSLSAEGAMAIVQQDQTFELWDLSGRRARKTRLDEEKPQGPIIMAAVGASKEHLFISHAQSGSVHHLGEGRVVHTVPTARIIDAEVIPGRGLVVAATNKGLLLIRASDGRVQKLLLPTGGPAVQALTVDPSGRYVTAVLRSTIQIWDLELVDGLAAGPE